MGEEAAMAAITFKPLHGTQQLREQIGAALVALRDRLDGFVSSRMRQSDAEAGGWSAAAARHATATEQPPIIAMELMEPDLSRHVPGHSTAAVERERTPAASQSAEVPATIAAPFQRLDPGILSDTIPAFFIGRNKEGFWVARDVNGKIGGIFLFENSALAFAKRNSRPAACATIYPSERFELDLENQGNPLVAALASLLRLATRLVGRQADSAGR